jgi:WD40 repeat protein
MEIANGAPLFWDSAGEPIAGLNPDPLDNQTSTATIGWDSDGSPLIAGSDSPLSGQDLEQRISGALVPSVIWIERQADRVEITIPGIPVDIAWAPDGQALAIAYLDRVEIVTWNSDADLIRQVLQGHRDTVVGLEWSPSGDYLASYSLDGSVVFWQFVE